MIVQGNSKQIDIMDGEQISNSRMMERRYNGVDDNFTYFILTYCCEMKLFYTYSLPYMQNKRQSDR